MADQRQTRASSKEPEQSMVSERSEAQSLDPSPEEPSQEEPVGREAELRRKIAAVTALKREYILQNELEELEAEVATLSLGGRNKATREKSGTRRRSRDRSDTHRRSSDRGGTHRRRSRSADSEESAPSEEDGMEAWTARDSKHRSRPRRKKSSRRHHHCRSHSSSSSRSRSTSKERRVRRKYSLKNFSDKEPKERNLHDIVLANLKWAVASKSMSAADKDGVMKHVGYMIMKASAESYPNKAYQGYDKDIRRIAVNKGMRAFVGGNMDVSMEHFAAEKRSYQASGRSGGQAAHPARRRVIRRKGSCEAWNSATGCSKGAGCDGHHNCCYCWDPAHRGSDCKDRGSGAFKPPRR